MKMSKLMFGTLSWVFNFGIICYFSFTSEERTTRDNQFIATFMIMMVISTIGLNTAERLPFTTIGKIPQMLRGIHITYICILIMIVTSKYEDARDIYLIFDKPPTEATLKKQFSRIEDCSFKLDHFFRTFNYYYLAHFFGWIVHGLILRDFALLHSWSLLTEVTGSPTSDP